MKKTNLDNPERIEITYTDYARNSETLVYWKNHNAFVIEKWTTKDGAMEWLNKHREHFKDEYEVLFQKLESISSSFQIDKRLENFPTKQSSEKTLEATI